MLLVLLRHTPKADLQRKIRVKRKVKKTWVGVRK